MLAAKKINLPKPIGYTWLKTYDFQHGKAIEFAGVKTVFT